MPILRGLLIAQYHRIYVDISSNQSSHIRAEIFLLKIFTTIKTLIFCNMHHPSLECVPQFYLKVGIQAKADSIRTIQVIDHSRLSE